MIESCLVRRDSRVYFVKLSSRHSFMEWMAVGETDTFLLVGVRGGWDAIKGVVVSVGLRSVVEA